MEITEDSRLAPEPSRPARKYLKGMVVEPGLTLNETAADFYTRMDGTRTVGAICQELQEEYDVDYDTLLRDCSEMARQLVDEGAAVVVE
jgi:hypothetical protein